MKEGLPVFLDNSQLTGNIGAFLERGPGPGRRPAAGSCGTASMVNVVTAGRFLKHYLGDRTGGCTQTRLLLLKKQTQE